MERESKILEYKESISKTYLKTVSAFANYGGGKIIFGINDDKEIVGLDNPEEECLSIENMINDNIAPVPSYSLTILADNTIELYVNDGLYKPYLYKNKAFKRNDSSTIEVDRLEFNRLVLEGSNQTFDQQISKDQNLKFEVLEKEMAKKLEVKVLSNDILKTLELMDSNLNYNNAAALLADVNEFQGVDIIRFGNNIDEILDRKTINHVSILKQFHDTIEFFEKYYMYEKIDGEIRRTIELIPKKAFREALANALVHRLWDINNNIRVSMYKDRIEISSPGGLPTGISKEEYLKGQVSILRNPIIGGLFFRLKYIEKFGTGIKRIKEAYSLYAMKPKFEVYENSILVVLPLEETSFELDDVEKAVINILKNGRALSRLQIEKQTGYSKDKVIRILNNLIAKKVVVRVGEGRNSKYTMSL